MLTPHIPFPPASRPSLLLSLQDVSDEVRSAFVTSFNLEDLERKMKQLRLNSSGKHQPPHHHDHPHQPHHGPHLTKKGLEGVTAASRMASVTASRVTSATAAHPLSGMHRKAPPPAAQNANRGIMTFFDRTSNNGAAGGAGAGAPGSAAAQARDAAGNLSAVNNDLASFKYTLYRWGSVVRCGVGAREGW